MDVRLRAQIRTGVTYKYSGYTILSYNAYAGFNRCPSSAPSIKFLYYRAPRLSSRATRTRTPRPCCRRRSKRATSGLRLSSPDATKIDTADPRHYGIPYRINSPAR